MGINVSTEAHSGEPRLYNPRWPSILFLKELAQFVPGTELWVSNFFTLYLEKVIKWFSPQASPTGGCYFKLKNKIRKQNEKGDQITHLWKGRHTKILPRVPPRLLTAHTYPSHPQPRPSFGLSGVAGSSPKSPSCGVRGPAAPSQRLWTLYGIAKRACPSWSDAEPFRDWVR